MDDVDEVIGAVLAGCLEAVCHEPDGWRCPANGILMSGTEGWADVIAERAGGHGEATGHRTSVRTWASA